MIENLIDRPELGLLMLAAILLATYFGMLGRRQLLAARHNFIPVPEKRSCFDCDDHFVLAPGYAPQGVYSVAVKETTLRCRKMLRDEVRLAGPDFQKEWGFAYDQPAGDYVAVATKCPKFTVIQGGKK